MTTKPTDKTAAHLEPLNKELIDTYIGDSLWWRLVGRIVNENPEIDEAMACRIMDQTVAFLQLCAAADRRYTPSQLVDIGWETFILYTQEYHVFCLAIAGRYLHHSPFDEEGVDYSNMGYVGDTVAALKEQQGIVIDTPLWTSQSDCGGDKWCCI